MSVCTHTSCPLFYKQCTIHTKATWDMLQRLQTVFHHQNQNTMTNVSRFYKRWQNFWNIVNCALLTQYPTQGFFSVWFYEKHINNLEVQLEKRFWAHVQEVQIFLPSWLKEADLTTIQHFDPRSDLLGNVAVTQYSCFTVWAEKQSAWTECIQIPEQHQEERAC